MVTLAEARANKTKVDWAGYQPVKPKFLGRRVFKNYDLNELANYIDWGPFFQTWDLAGPYPAILNDEIVGESARRVFSDRRAASASRVPRARARREGLSVMSDDALSLPFAEPHAAPDEITAVSWNLHKGRSPRCAPCEYVSIRGGARLASGPSRGNACAFHR
ncbi:hypothetical protein KPA96_14435 [Burkholderia cenocepacia]|nr:hypothetical protein [Burkholderia cenocepacia]